MDYKKFFEEVADWIYKVNDMATRYGMDSKEFWDWVMESTSEISERYQNNKLVINQMTMLYMWLEDVNAEMKRG